MPQTPSPITKKELAWKIFFSLSALEGLFALFFIFYAPSEGKNAFLWGYSVERLVLGAFAFILLISFVFLTIGAWKKTSAYIRFIDWIETYINENICVVLAWLLFGFITLLVMVILLISPLAVHLNNLRSALLRSLPILLWGFIIFSQAGILLWRQYASRMQVRIRDILRVSLLPSLLFFSFSHWLILAFRIQLFTIIDGWYWPFRIREIPNFWIFLPIFVLSLAVVFIVIKSPERTKRNILMLMVLGYFLQLSFGFIEAGGLESVQRKYTGSGHNSYALYAADRPSLDYIFSHYEEVYGVDQFAGTKPPGLILFYVLTQRASALFFPQDNYDLRFKGLISFATYLYPFLAVLVIPALYRFSRFFLNAKQAILPPLLYIFFPNFLLMPLFLDQSLYPLLFIISLDLVLRSLIQRSYLLAFLAGISTYISLYFTFSLLPLLLLALTLISIYYFGQKDKKIKTYLALGANLVAGLLFAFIFFRVFLNYDPFLRYSHAFAQHRNLKSFESGIGQILDSMLLNNVDYMSSIGFPVALLAIAHSIRTFTAFLKKRFTLLNILTLAFTLTYLALLIAGQTRGEVGRLWSFFNPLIALFAIAEMRIFFKRSIYNIPFVVTLELITTIFIFKFQNFFA